MNTIVTHNGVFHADEVFAISVLTTLYPDAVVVRTRKAEVISQADIAVDVGGGCFDHHHRGGQKARENGVPLASAGLVWSEFGRLYCQKIATKLGVSFDLLKGIEAEVDKWVVEAIDAQDCGKSHSGRHCLNWVSAFNSSWLSAEDHFERVVELAKDVIEQEVAAIISRMAARESVLKQIREVPEGQQFIVLKTFLPWIDTVTKSEEAQAILLVVFQDISGDWRVQTVPVGGEDRFANRYTFPEAWRGVSGEGFESLTGVAGVTFCHPGGFILGVKSLEGALEVVKKALA